MDRLKKLLHRPEFMGILFIVVCLLFLRPLVVMFKGGSFTQVWLSIYIPWFLVVLLIFFISRLVADDEPENEINSKEVDND